MVPLAERILEQLLSQAKDRMTILERNYVAIGIIQQKQPEEW
jgi:hypothetical protein